MTNKLSRMVTYLEGLLPIELLNPLVMWFCKITWQTKTITKTSKTQKPVATKPGRIVIYLERLLPNE